MHLAATFHQFICLWLQMSAGITCQIYVPVNHKIIKLNTMFSKQKPVTPNVSLLATPVQLPSTV